MILKIFSPNFSAKKMTFLTRNKAKLGKILIITLVCEKNSYFFAENCQKSPKILIITSTPGPNPATSEFTTTTPQHCKRQRVEEFFFYKRGMQSFGCKFLQRWRCNS
jgi:hypothetical protein